MGTHFFSISGQEITLRTESSAGQVSNLGHLGKSGLVPAIVTHFPDDLGHVTKGLASKGGCAQGGDAENPRCLVSSHLSSQHTQLTRVIPTIY